MPMDIEWAKDGESGELFVVQSRPETVQSQRSRDTIETFVLEKRGKLLTRGLSVGSEDRIWESQGDQGDLRYA